MLTIVKLGLVALALTLAACGKNTDQRQSQRVQNEANSKAEVSDLKAAEGRFEGQMTMSQSHQVFAAVLQTQIVYKIIRGTGSDSTVPQSVPILTGNLSFPALAHITSDDFLNFAELLDPMGNYTLMTFEDGDYDPNTQALTLWYSIPEFHGYFGELIAKVANGIITGTWTSRIQIGSSVGSFNLNQVQTTTQK